MDTKKTFFELYHVQGYENVESVLLSINEVNNLGFTNIIDQQSIWYVIDRLCERIAHKEDEAWSWTHERVILSLVDLQLLKQLAVLGKLLFSDKLDNKNYDSSIKNREGSDLFASLKNVHLTEVGLSFLVSVLESKTGKDKEESLRALTEFVGIYNQLLNQILTVGAWFNLLLDLTFYSVDEVEQIISGEKTDIDFLRFVFTLRDAYDSDEGRDVILFLTQDMLSDTANLPVKPEQHTWDQAIIRTIYLLLVFHRFDAREDEKQQDLLKYFFYQAIVAGVSVREILSSVLYNTQNPVDVVEISEFFYVGLSQNIESVIINTDTGDTRSFQDIVSELKLDNTTTGTENISLYVKKLYSGQKYSNQFVVWLSEALSIILAIEDGTLINKNRGSELNEKQKYNNEIIELVQWFLDKNTWDNINKYYQNKDALVPIESLVKELPSVTSLENEKDIELVAGFSEFLHQHDFTPKDQDLLFFNESDNQFHWNEDFFKQ